MPPRLLLPLLLAACSPDPVDTVRDTGDGPPPPDLGEVLGIGETRAGFVTDTSVLFGGTAAEGQAGDVKIYNARVQFVIQGMREGGYTVQQGGCVIDADLVRPEGQPGRDMVDDWVVMAGVGHIPNPTAITIVDDGQESGRAVVRVEGLESPVEYITGAFESPELVADWGMHFVTDYVLEADSHLLEVTTTLTAAERDVTVSLGDIVLGGKEQGDVWSPGAGMEEDLEAELDWVGMVGHWNDQAIGLFPQAREGWGPQPAVAFISGLLTIVSGFQPDTAIEEGQGVTWTRWYGVGPDLATLSDEWLVKTGQASEVHEGMVQAPDGPVAGARVNVLRDGAPWTLAVTGADGTFSARVPPGADVTYLVDGHGPGLHPDLPDGAGPYAPHAAEAARELALQSVAQGAEPVPLAQGRGIAEGTSPLTLLEPGTVSLRATDGYPFEARLSCTSGCVSGDRRLVQSAPSGLAALAWSLDGEVSFPVEPGTYRVTAWRGNRWETFQADLEVVAGETSSLEFSLEEAYTTDGWLVGDPHSHAAPSADGGITMTERVVVAAGTGIQLYFGTDHDHVIDYTPLVAPLGVEDLLAAVPAIEISPVMRGHLNAYPLVPDPALPNAGGYPWWRTEHIPEDTEAEFDAIHAWFPDAIIQVNHPMGGLATFASWSPGRIGNPDFWADGFDAVEVMNGGSHGEEVDFYLDLVSRGLLVAPVGVSDSHSHLGGAPGLNTTWIGLGIAEPSMVTPEDLVEAMTARRTIASTGPFLDMSISPGSVVTGSAELTVRALGPSWIQVDTIRLRKNGEVVETVTGTEATFTLAPDADAAFVVEASGSRSMSPISGNTPWALASAILVDVAGDGWDPPLPPLELADDRAPPPPVHPHPH